MVIEEKEGFKYKIIIKDEFIRVELPNVYPSYWFLNWKEDKNIVYFESTDIKEGLNEFLKIRDSYLENERYYKEKSLKKERRMKALNILSKIIAVLSFVTSIIVLVLVLTR